MNLLYYIEIDESDIVVAIQSTAESSKGMKLVSNDVIDKFIRTGEFKLGKTKLSEIEYEEVS